MVNRGFTGLPAWVVQRVSAIYMLLFILFSLAALAFQPRRTYQDWRACVADPLVGIAFAVFFVALFSHMWVGLRDVLLDYAKPAGLRNTLIAVLALCLLSLAAWVFQIILGAGT
ncbi:succinate dehydrogenase, hydrophobic membrane anchor protein [Variovorax ureilyticus]|uniref:Succinate dehydrogenase hydrophobic membrane anchor subunit n=1 Tax=Variovorax ureilyticus TaxID=1836198 RepID=A0ABU8VL44_9BURK